MAKQNQSFLKQVSQQVLTVIKPTIKVPEYLKVHSFKQVKTLQPHSFTSCRHEIFMFKFLKCWLPNKQRKFLIFKHWFRSIKYIFGDICEITWTIHALGGGIISEGCCNLTLENRRCHAFHNSDFLEYVKKRYRPVLLVQRRMFGTRRRRLHLLDIKTWRLLLQVQWLRFLRRSIRRGAAITRTSTLRWRGEQRGAR